MKNLLNLAIWALLIMVPGQAGAQKTTKPVPVPARIHNIPVHWFLDATTPNPAAFIDFYNGASYTQDAAIAHAASIDAFCYDRSHLAVSFQEVDLINMTNFGNGNFHVADTFHAVLGNPSFGAYTTSTFSDVSMTPVEFSKIKYNADIAALFRAKSLNGGYADLGIPARDLLNSNKYYQFVCANGKRGFFHVTGANYLPGSTMTIEVKVEQ